MLKDTIVAIATGPAEGAIGILRLSGKSALSIAGLMFRPRRGGLVGDLEPYRLTLGIVVDPETSGEIDEVLGVVMPGPRSYTGEDIVEFQAHGGRAILAKIVQAAIVAGARPAEPGEFTRRAFLNGRLDLAQAEAVIDLIRSRSGLAREEALKQLRGRLSENIERLRSGLTDMSARIEAHLEFGEEDQIEEDLPPAALEEFAEIIEGLLSSSEEGKTVREGFRITVTGRKNTGKSSIINKIVGKERSIVTPCPGTTRDVIESGMLLEGIDVVLIDTAGLGPAGDPVEEEGIRRSQTCLISADLAVVVLDSSEALTKGDRDLLLATGDMASVIAMNKSDLPPLLAVEDFVELAKGRPFVRTSALTGSGIGDLRLEMGNAIRTYLSSRRSEDPLITNSRHQDVFRRALRALRRGQNNLVSGGALDMAATDVREALSALGEITGETVTEELLDRIFSRFCIGK